ncbi:T9SS type B sorting domain-containing protein [Pedobacter sp. LMG 31464]|uniref:T9SS type B sorting domain-containing protein n=1 Tax=Pedobacter planticolens TaxID=2679964 RepID=A0A923DV19_9SPHI|nr:gliding motility-associated C-terminal domain-containing protein [Pedobacter planticolens]MBB2144424.1 T9SS type B sorting domain-containing protein [Pedobacter planticolens]
MRKLLPFILFSLFSSHLFSQVTLSTSPFTENFSGIGTALPNGFTIRTGSTASVLGTVATYTATPAAATAWASTTGGFKNFASATAGSTTSAANQNIATDRALGLRQTAAIGDPTGAFVFQLANTTGKSGLKLSFDLQSLDASSTRIATWRVDYGFGAAPTTFTAATATGTLTTGSGLFSNNNINVDFGTALDNNAGPIWIRIVTLAATTGAGNRPSSAIDNFNLTFTSGGSATPTLVANPTSLAFGNQTVGVNSTSKTYTITGTDLTIGVDVTVASPFTVSKDNSTFSGAINYTVAEAAASPTVYVSYTPTIAGASTANVLNVSSGATSVNVALTGTGVTGDVSPPVNTATFPKVNNIAISTFDLVTNISEAGKSYYVVLPSTGTAPTTVAQVKAGQDGSGVAAFKSGTITNTANTDATANITGLTGATAYTIYVVAEDNVPNIQNTITTLTATTANVPLVSSPIIISQYYEGASVNKWIELTNLSNAPINTGTLNLKLALYNISGDAGNISITGTPSQTMPLNITIPARGTVIIGNTGNGNEVPYLTSTSAAQNSNTVINFNGNDGVALLDANGNIIDAFGTGVNAKDVSYVRSINVTDPSPTFIVGDWERVTLAVVQNAIDGDDVDQLGVHFPPNLPVCAGPTVSPTALTFSSVTTGSITGTFTKSTDANEYLIIRSLNSTLSATPADGTSYVIGSSFGGGSVVNKIVSNTFTDNNLVSSTNYYYFIFPLNNLSCTGGPKYLTTNVLTASQTTKTLLPCATPAAQPTNFNVTSSNYNFVQGAFTASTADEYLVVMSTTSTLSAAPVNQTVYTVGDQIGGGTVVKRGTGNTFIRNGLLQNTTYYFFIYSLNSACSSGPLYLTANPLKGSFKTGILDLNKLNFYFGNLHSHSSYSDGNKDDLTKKPEDDYAFAKNSMNLDFLGISEHNHTQAGMSLANWQPGITAAKNATTSTFVALHGMEWGVISGGGHVIVYGIDSLIGWEPGENQIYVPKSVYTGTTGLFRIINRHGLNAVATLAHPNTTDFNNISATYDLSADSAIVGTALESGPAFSTNVTYSDPASSMSYINYYNTMLAKGYHLGATIDHDNHNFTFGRHTRARLVVLAPTLTENDLLDAIKKMRFYASEDSAAKVTYTINKQPVGSIFINPAGPEISITSKTTSPVTSIKLMYGTPGSSINPVEVTSSTTGTLTYTHAALPNLATGYYYADIVESDGSRIITSPIWYTRNDAYVKKNQNITLAAIKTVTYGDPDFPIGATSDNTEINLTYTSSDTNIATISNNDIHILKAGTVTITANQEGNAFYNAATSKTLVLTIAPKQIAVTAVAKTKIQGATDPTLTYTYIPVLIGSDVFTGNITRTVGETPGDYTINQGTLAINANYQIGFTSAIFKIIPKPVGTIIGTAAACINSTAPNVTFTATVGTAPFTFTYNINGGSTKTVIINSPNTSVTVAAPTNVVGSFVYNLVSIADANTNQTLTGTATITINPLPIINVASNNGITISKGTSVILSANGAVNYTWSPSTDVIAGQGTASLTVRPKQTTTYTVTGTNASGCTSTQSITIQVSDDYQITALNILTPNGDGKNDKFIIQNIDYYPNNTVKVFDRSGRTVYTKKGYDNQWDGTFNGSPLASDTYYYTIDFGPNIAPFKGYITIVRN